MHLVIVIPPKYAVSDIVGKIKANTSREIRKRFPWIKKIYPMFKGVWSTVAIFAPLALPDTRYG